MHVEIKAALFNFVTYDKSRGQPNIYFRTNFFRTEVLHHFFNQKVKKVRVRTKKGRVVSPDPDKFLFRLTT